MLRTYSNLDSTTEARITEVIDCGFVIHRDVGPGFMEPLYSNAMCVELRARNIPFEREKVVTVKYRDEPVGIHRLDFLIWDSIVVELKAVKAIEPVHQAQNGLHEGEQDSSWFADELLRRDFQRGHKNASFYNVTCLRVFAPSWFKVHALRAFLVEVFVSS